MAEEEPKTSALTPPSGGEISPSEAQTPARILSTTLAEALSKIADPEAKAMLSIALSRTTLGFGPDPETAKILADSEMHQEDCRLKGYTAQLQNKDSQNSRDHDFRCKRLNREFAMNIAVLVASITGAVTGLYLLVQGHSQIGSNLLIASAGILLYILKGSADFLGK
jgi:hypothetical protein